MTAKQELLEFIRELTPEQVDKLLDNWDKVTAALKKDGEPGA